MYRKFYFTLFFVLWNSFLKKDSVKRAPACLAFTVMDHDFMMANDFAGEAYLALKDVAGVMTSRPSSLSALQPITLALSQPKSSDS